MDLQRLALLTQKPALFEAGEAHFWDDPYIATQMLKAHLDPTTDAASRKPETIERTVDWIIQRSGIQAGQRLLDLGCGPGLYTALFAERGIQVTGVDFSENSLRYAREHDPHSTYILADYTQLDLVDKFDVITLIYGDFCVLDDVKRATLLHKITHLLNPNGYFIFDVSSLWHPNYQQEKSSWSVVLQDGFWKPSPYLLLFQTFDYPEDTTKLAQYIVIEAADIMSVYRIWTRYYTPESLAQVLTTLQVEEFYSDLMGTPLQPDSEWLGVVAQHILKR